MKSPLNRKKSMALGLLAAGLSLITACGGGGGSATPVPPEPSQTFGVVALSEVGSIGILDGKTQALSSVRLTGELGTYEGGLLDVVISPDGKTTLVSNFNDAKVFFIDTSDPSAPTVKGSVTTSYFDTATPPVEHKVYAEDMTMTPDGRFALVTDGGNGAQIFVIDVATRTLVEMFDDNDPAAVPPINHMHQSVAVAADSRTVLTADYFNQMVHVLTLSTDGHLTFVKSIDVSNQVLDPVSSQYVKTLRPLNVAISPDGKTAIVACVPGYKDAANSIDADMAFPVLNITGPGEVSLSDMVVAGTVLKGAQSIAFNRAGTKAYLMCTQPLPDPYPTDPAYPGPKNVIRVLNVTAPGKASDAAVSIEVESYGRSQWFGVDTLAMDNPGKYLYVSNPTGSGAKNHIQVVDVDTNQVIKTITFAPIDVPVGTPPVLTTTDAVPAGIAFWRN